MSVISKSFASSSLENGPDDLFYFTDDSAILSYSTSVFSYTMWDRITFNIYGEFPDFEQQPATYGELLNSSAGESTISNYSVAAASGYEDEPEGTLLLEEIISTPTTLAAISVPNSYQYLADYYSGDDTFIASKSASVGIDDKIFGFAGNDTFYTYGTGERYDKVYGGDGIDTSVYESPRSNYDVFKAPNNVYNVLTDSRDLEGYTVVDLVGDDSGDQLVDVERLRFTDTNVALDFDRGENGYRAASLITSMFGSEFIEIYFAPALNLIDQGMNETEIAQLVIDLGMISVSSSPNFVAAIYENVVGVSPDPLTQALYASQIDNGDLTHAGLVAIGAGVPLIESQILELGVWRESGFEYLSF